MPAIQSQVSNLQAIGPIIDVQIGPSALAIPALQKAGKHAHPTIVVSAMIDTGASGCVIKTGIPQQLGLFPTSSQLINTPSSEDVPCDVYYLRLTFFPTSGGGIPIHYEGAFIEAPLKGQNIQCLIGRDLLAHAVLTYIGPANTFVLNL
jgi:hypothetical protein